MIANWLKFKRLNLTVWSILLIQGCVNSACLNSVCQCYGNKMFCNNGEIPTDVPLEINELFIDHFDLDNVDRIQLKNVSALIKLDIQADRGKEILPKSFKQFFMLRYLGVHGKELESIDPGTFLGLENLLTLNLSSNLLLEVKEISGALDSENRTVLPNLEYLSISKVKSFKATPVKLDREFSRSIANGRKLKHLDLSELNIFRIDYTESRPICNSVESIDLRKSVIGNGQFVEAEACASLKTIDLSESIFPVLRLKFSVKSLDFLCEGMSFFANLENFLASKVNTQHDIEIDGYLLDMSKCAHKFRKIDISGNKIKWLNMTVRIHEATKRSISELNISYNGLEYVSPLFLQPSESLEILDLSNNKLSVMQENYREEFEVLFSAKPKLLYLNLSSNSLSEIPEKTFFENVMLKVLDISFNKIEKIDFLLLQLVNIEKLIVSYNRIHTIEENTRKGLQLLWARAYDNITHGDIQRQPFRVYLKGNLFACTCDKMNMKMIDWLYSTAVIDEYEAVTCKLDGKVVDIRDSAPRDTKHFCTMQIVKKVAIISAPFALSSLILSIIIVVTARKRRKKKRQIRAVIAQIEMDAFPLPYLAFLSYCSEDMDLVVNKIYPQLSEKLSKRTISNKQLVCCGDKHFRPGFALRYEVMRCVDDSSVFIAVISNNFCRKKWCNIEIGWAYDQNKPIIMLMVEHVEKEIMDEFLRKIFDRYAHATWIPDNNGGHIQPDWKIFCTSIIQLAGKSAKERRRDEQKDLV